MLKAIIFDFDYTLGDSTNGIALSINYALEKLGYAISNIEDIKNFKEELRNKFKPATYYKIKADYCDTLTDEQIIEIYSNIRNDFIKKFFIL